MKQNFEPSSFALSVAGGSDHGDCGSSRETNGCPRLREAFRPILGLLVALLFTADAIAASPARPTGLRGKESPAGMVELRWKDTSSNELNFQIQSRMDPGSFSVVASAPAGTTKRVVTIPTGVVHVFRVRARGSDGDSRWSNSCWVNANPSRPTKLVAAPRTSTGVPLSWQSNSPYGKGFRIQRRPVGSTAYTKLADVRGGALSHVDASAAASSAYEYRVRALGKPAICIAHSRWSAPILAEGASAPVSRKLTVSRSGSGAGSVSSTPAGIACGATCSAGFAHGSSVTLTATAASGSTFSGWSGACAGVSPTCVVQMSSDKTATATFQVSGVTCPTSGPLTDLRRDCSSRQYRYGNAYEDASLNTNGSEITIHIESDLIDYEAYLYGTVTSATSFRYNEACVPGLGCATVNETGAILSSGNTLRLNLLGKAYSYSFKGTGSASRVAISGGGSLGEDGPFASGHATESAIREVLKRLLDNP